MARSHTLCDPLTSMEPSGRYCRILHDPILILWSKGKLVVERYSHEVVVRIFGRVRGEGKEDIIA